MKGLEYNNLFGLKLCKIMFKKGFNKWVMVNFYIHTHLLFDDGIRPEKIKKDGLVGLIGVKL
jgi:hypothetical protein